MTWTHQLGQQRPFPFLCQRQEKHLLEARRRQRRLVELDYQGDRGRAEGGEREIDCVREHANLIE